RVRIVVVRDGARQPATVTIGEMPSEEPTVRAQAGEDGFGLHVEPLSPGIADRLDGFGLHVEPLSPGIADRLNLAVSQGVFVVDVAAGGPAARGGLRRGDVILEVGRQPVSDVQTFGQALAAIPPGETALLYLHRPGADARNQYVVLDRGAPK